ncbi:MAG TPA: hypothetical protein GX692_06040 [Acholeplasmataceae bacterium]|nr:hypothetical protein [Acholeplasmataceae bacterium]
MNYQQGPYMNPYENNERVVPFLTGVALGTAFPNRYFYPNPYFYPFPFYPSFPFRRFPRRRRRFFY